MDNYYELKITINPDMEDIVSDICFSNLSCEGVLLEEETYKDLEMVSTTKGTLRVFLTDIDNSPIEILKTEREILKSRGFSDDELGSWDITIDEKENQDWSKKWKEKWTVTHVTDKITVVPSWLNYEPKEDEVIITLDPSCAFGTGTHQTTQLCMKALEKYLKPNSSVADIGTGSGILAILAKKLGASYTYGCDNDETVIDVAKENARKNGIQPNPPLAGGSTSPMSGWGNSVKHPSAVGSTSSIPEWGNSQQPSSNPPLAGGATSLMSGWGPHSHRYTKFAKQASKELRNNATKQERKLWQYLKNSQLMGYKFRRQQPIGRYILDFFCPELRLAIELDGGQHNTNDNIEYDILRDKFLLEQKINVIRIWNNDIDNNIEGVVDCIKNKINKLKNSEKWEYPRTAMPHPGIEDSDPPARGGCELGVELHDSSMPHPGIEDSDPPARGRCELGADNVKNDLLRGGCEELKFELNTADKINRKFDFVCANILHNVLFEIMGDLKNILKDDGILSLSGILDEKKDVVLEAIKRENLKIIETITQDKWISYIVKKK